MVEERAVDLLLLMLCHCRPARLRAALTQVLVKCPKKTGLKVAVVLSPDRPTPAVRDICHQWQDHPQVLYRPLTKPVISVLEGKQWIRARNWMLCEADGAGIQARWLTSMDDDWLWGPGWDEHLPKMLNQDRIISWAVVSLVLWERADGSGLDVNVRQRHFSPLFGLYKPGWRLNPSLTNFTTMQVEQVVANDGDRAGVAPFFILDSGTIKAAERRRMYREYLRSGKTCDYVKNYVRDPIRMPVEKALAMEPYDFFVHQLSRDPELKIR